MSEEMRARFASLRKAPTPYHQAAAVLAAFDPARLRTAGGAGPPAGEDLRRLLADSEPAPPQQAGGGAGGRPWALRHRQRKEALRAFADRRAMRAALLANERRADDPVQRALDACILGQQQPQPAAAAELEALAQAVVWLAGAPASEPLELPDLGEVRRRLDLARLLDPLRDLVERDWRDRQRELGQIRRFVGDSGGYPPPLAIGGGPGSGKSALLARLLLILAEEAPGLCPFVYLDLARETLSPQEPGTLLREAVWQFGAQVPGARPACEQLRNRLDQDLAKAAAAGLNAVMTRAPGVLRGRLESERLSRFAEIVQGSSPGPLVIVLDTVEEVSFRDFRRVGDLWDFLVVLCGFCSLARVVVAGQDPETWSLPEGAPVLRLLDPEAAVASAAATPESVLEEEAAAGAEQALPAGLGESHLDPCPDRLSRLPNAELRQLLTDRMSRTDLGAVWYDTLGDLMDDQLPGRGVPDCVIELITRARQRGRFADLCRNLIRERPDLCEGLP